MQNRLRLFIAPLITLFAIILAGTIGYWYIGKGEYSLVDCLYMTVITITTIGYSEIIDLNNNSIGRLFTLLIAISGIGVLGYSISTFTGFIIEGSLDRTLKIRKILKMLKKLENHYIVCGIALLGNHILAELNQSKHPYVVIDMDQERINQLLLNDKDLLYIIGDCTDNSILLEAGVERATGLFAAMKDDNTNLVVSLSAKNLNPSLKIIASCSNLKNIEKMKIAGADSVVSPKFIGGMRMVSEMIRPTVVSFLDMMLRGQNKELRIEEIRLNKDVEGKNIKDLKDNVLNQFEQTLLLALKHKGEWHYHPRNDYVVYENDFLIVMTSPEEREKLAKELSYGT